MAGPEAPRDQPPPDRIQRFLDEIALSASQQREIDFYRRADAPGSRVNLFDAIVDKANFIRILRARMGRLALENGMSILELGAGHGWAGSMIKRAWPGCRVVLADLSPPELAHAAEYERLLGVSLDELWACSATRLPSPDNRFDRVFTFAAFHHFGCDGEFGPALAETVRVLKPGGRAVLLYENYAPRWALSLMRRRARRQRNFAVDEDVLELGGIRKACRSLPCRLTVEYDPLYSNRESLLAANYMLLLNRVPALARFLPCTVNLTIRKDG